MLLIGIPIFTIVLGDAGKVLTLALKLFLTSSPENRKAYSLDDEFNVPLRTGLTFLTMYSLIGTTAFAYIESEWGLFSSFYFVFITTSTVGFGDYFPSNPVVAVMSSLYFLFGLALCSMVLGLIQETVDAPINNLTKKVTFILGMGPEPIDTKRSASESEEHMKGD
ncbi:TWiK family of potassium channels protein 18 [Orchesella cincta]|uniref:TWiK family of potassium channels protein 18 n=1 Tax=Orchesella cincta TaxID=48709 RepID=A0A1D2MX33_ORCCI|nr:TWiK family of potassium channels protein 18 [Orchesella cincta]